MILDPDKLNHASPKAVGAALMAAVSRLQNFQAELQAHAAALLFIAICAASKASAFDVMTAAKNLLDASKDQPEIAAALEYVREEIVRDVRGRR